MAGSRGMRKHIQVSVMRCVSASGASVWDQSAPQLWALAGLPPPNGIVSGGGSSESEEDLAHWPVLENSGQGRAPGGPFTDPRGNVIVPGTWFHDKDAGWQRRAER